MRIFIKNGTLVDPSRDFEGRCPLLIDNDRIVEADSFNEAEADRVIDAEGLTILPGLVDLHVHLRDPGLEYKETLETGCAAASRGGVTALVAMGNTKPPVDTAERARAIMKRAEKLPVRLFQAGTLTMGMQGETLTDMEAMVKAGVRAFSEDGKSVMNTARLYEAMETAARLDVPILSHCEDINLVRGGVMNADRNAERLGLKGITNAVEDIITARNAIVARETGCRVHLCHCSTAGSMTILRQALAAGTRISAEVCPHHLLLTSDDIPGNDGNYKMNPPLRTKADVDALREALLDGTVSCISTDHAPHSDEEKTRGFASPFGIVGIETAAALIYTEFVRTGQMTLCRMAEKMSLNPARVLGIEGGSLRPGSRADIAVFDFEHPYTIDPAEFLSKGHNTPFTGKTVYGRTKLTLCGGRTAWEERI